jgi:hypothetical protein
MVSINQAACGLIPSLRLFRPITSARRHFGSQHRRRVKRLRKKIVRPGEHDSALTKVLNKATRTATKNLKGLDEMAENRASKNLAAISPHLESLGKQVEAKFAEAQSSVRALWFTDNNRPQRVGPVMDRRWWAWNLAFAASPALLIVLFCEYQRPGFEEYSRQLEKRDRTKLEMAQRGVDDDDDDEIFDNDLEIEELRREGGQVLGDGQKETNDTTLLLLRRVELLERTLKTKQERAVERKKRNQAVAEEDIRRSPMQARREERTVMERREQQDRDILSQVPMTLPQQVAIKLSLMMRNVSDLGKEGVQSLHSMIDPTQQGKGGEEVSSNIHIQKKDDDSYESTGGTTLLRQRNTVDSVASVSQAHHGTPISLNSDKSIDQNVNGLNNNHDGRDSKQKQTDGLWTRAKSWTFGLFSTESGEPRPPELDR